MKIGWHIHPYGTQEGHERTERIEFRDFMKMLEKELKKRGKI